MAVESGEWLQEVACAEPSLLSERPLAANGVLQ
jgi:hypothetical protein